MIQAFSEGLTLDGTPVQDPVRLLGNTTCGFELLRQLAQQFSLRSRAEALSMRSELLQRIFALKNSEMNQATVVGDVIRKIDIEVARYSKLLGTLPFHLDRQGLSIGDGDMLIILLRSLPEEAKKYVLHHSLSDTYLVARTAALRFEQQQRLFLDLNFGSRKTMNEIFYLTQSDGDGAWDTAWYHDMPESSIAALNRDRCEKCGRKHRTQDCFVDMTKVKCFACQGFGHVSANCPGNRSSSGEKGKEKGKGKGKEKGKAKGKGKGKEKGKEKGKGKGKSKKRKMYEVSSPGEEESWSWEETWQNEAWGVQDWGEAWAEQDWQVSLSSSKQSLSQTCFS